MEKELEQCKLESLSLCDRILIALEGNREEANLFFSGKVLQAYDAATEKAKNKVKRIKNAITNL